MRQALAILLTVTGGLLLGTGATRSEAAVNDKTNLPPVTPLAGADTLPTSTAPLTFEERVANARKHLMVATPEDQQSVEGAQIYWRNWANWRWGNGGWRNWNNWNNWRNWSNWSNWNNW